MDTEFVSAFIVFCMGCVIGWNNYFLLWGHVDIHGFFSGFILGLIFVLIVVVFYRINNLLMDFENNKKKRNIKKNWEAYYG